MGEVQKFIKPNREGDFRITGSYILRGYCLTMGDEWNTLTVVPSGWLWD
jgi:hypothetical protein